MGNIFTQQGIAVDPMKIKALEEMPRPHDEVQVRSFLEMVNYMSKFVPNVVQTAAVLREFKNVWTSEHEKAWIKLKHKLVNAPILKYFDVTEEVTLQVDASSNGLGAVLLQHGDPVAYAPRTLSASERKYAQIEKQTLAIVFGVKRFEKYLFGTKILVESDHKPLEIIVRKLYAMLLNKFNECYCNY